MAVGDVLLEPVLNRYTRASPAGQRVAKRRLVDRGDHVEWQDRAGTSRWRLPDQPEDPELPTLAKVVRIRTQTYGKSTTSIDAVVLVAGDGRALACFPAVVLSDEVWPAAAFDGLAARGVPFHVWNEPDARRVAAAYPAVISRRTASFTSLTAWMIVYFVPLVVLLVLTAFAGVAHIRLGQRIDAVANRSNAIVVTARVDDIEGGCTVKGCKWTSYASYVVGGVAEEGVIIADRTPVKIEGYQSIYVDPHDPTFVVRPGYTGAGDIAGGIVEIVLTPVLGSLLFWFWLRLRRADAKARERAVPPP